jgi:glycosyltransferase involved in cell wall biosynthesis
MELKITFIIPTIGRTTLVNAINSLKKQSNPNWKAIIVFDGCQVTYKSDDRRIGVMRVEKLGLGYNSAGEVRNKGINFVKTEWVAFLDDDDTISSNYVETFYNEIGEFNDVDTIIFRMSYHDNKDTIFPRLDDNNFHMNFVGISFAYKKKIFDNGIKFIPSNYEDYDILNRIRENNFKMMISPYIRYFVRCNEYEEHKTNTIVGERVFIN